MQGRLRHLFQSLSRLRFSSGVGISIYVYRHDDMPAEYNRSTLTELDAHLHIYLIRWVTNTSNAGIRHNV